MNDRIQNHKNAGLLVNLGRPSSSLLAVLLFCGVLTSSGDSVVTERFALPDKAGKQGFAGRDVISSAFDRLQTIEGHSPSRFTEPTDQPGKPERTRLTDADPIKRTIAAFALLSAFVSGIDDDDKIAVRHKKFTNSINLTVRAINANNTGIKIPISKKLGFTNEDAIEYQAFLEYFHDKYGVIKKIDSTLYFENHARMQVTTSKGRWTMRVLMSQDGLVEGINFIDPDPIIPVPERNSFSMILPFDGEWAVTSGGSTPELNDHIKGDHRSARLAVDFVIQDVNGREFRDNGSKNEDYYAFGKEILAVADGEVVVVMDGALDNRPRTENPMTSSGNAVIIKHKDFEYSDYDHLKCNSICVKVGQKVVAGQVIGLCGNSGASNGPHLHFGLSNSEVAYDGTGFSPYFTEIIVMKNGESVNAKDYSPQTFDKLKNKKRSRVLAP